MTLMVWCNCCVLLRISGVIAGDITSCSVVESSEIDLTAYC